MANSQQLTRGPIGWQLIFLSAPLLAGNILQQLYNTVDAVIVGRFVGESAFGAVGVSGSVMNLFLFLISGGCDGVGALLSQFYGAEDGGSFRRGFYLSGLFGAGVSAALTGLGLLVLPGLLALLHTPDSVAAYAMDYLQIIFLGFPAAFAYHLSSGALRVVLSALLAPGMGLPAVALATGLGWIGVVTFWNILVRKEREQSGEI